MADKNTEKQLLKEMDHELVITVGGESLQDVTGKIFQVMRKQIFQEIKKPIIHLEAEEVYFQNIKEQKTTEHFMLVFWPREKVSYEVTAKVVVKIKYLDIEESV